MKPCLAQGCPRMAAPGKSYCPPCHRGRERVRDRDRSIRLPHRAAYRDPGYRAYPVAGRLCALQFEDICTGIATTRDHIIPLNKGGTNAWSNMQPACRECNAAKRDRVDDSG